MKNLLIIIGLMLSLSGFGQGETIDHTQLFHWNEVIDISDSTFAAPDTTLNPICAERGHVCGGVYFETLIYCEPYVVDHEDYSEMVYPACNYREYTCKRCGKRVDELEPERREIIWDKRNEKP